MLQPLKAGFLPLGLLWLAAGNQRKKTGDCLLSKTPFWLTFGHCMHPECNNYIWMQIIYISVNATRFRSDRSDQFRTSATHSVSPSHIWEPKIPPNKWCYKFYNVAPARRTTKAAPPLKAGVGLENVFLLLFFLT